jgi:hypothetical protein
VHGEEAGGQEAEHAAGHVVVAGEFDEFAIEAPGAPCDVASIRLARFGDETASPGFDGSLDILLIEVVATDIDGFRPATAAVRVSRPEGDWAVRPPRAG